MNLCKNYSGIRLIRPSTRSIPCIIKKIKNSFGITHTFLPPNYSLNSPLASPIPFYHPTTHNTGKLQQGCHSTYVLKWSHDPTSTTLRRAVAQHFPHNQKRNMYHMASTIGEKTCICCYCCVHAPSCNCIPSGEPIISFLPTPTNELQETKVFFQAIFHKPRPVFPVNIYGGRNWEDQTHSKPSKIPGEPLVRHQ